MEHNNVQDLVRGTASVTRHPPRILVAIGTLNRPERLRSLLGCLERQTVLPALTVVCDASDATIAAINKRIVGNASLPAAYLASGVGSVTMQRNMAIQQGLSSLDADFVCILDDDTQPPAHYLGALTDFLIAHPKACGVSGVTRPRWVDSSGRIGRLGKYLVGYRALRPGGVTAAGIGTPVPGDHEGPIQVEWLIGCAMWRTDVFRNNLFNGTFRGSSLGDDVEFSVRQRNRGQLWVLPHVILEHALEETGRPNEYLHAVRFVRNRYDVVQALGGGWRFGVYAVSLVAAFGVSAWRLLSRLGTDCSTEEEVATLKGLFRGTLLVLRRENPI